jgi:hypothetical protein
MIAVIAFDPCKTLTEVSAVQIFIDDIHHVRTPIIKLPALSKQPSAEMTCRWGLKFRTSPKVWTAMTAPGMGSSMFKFGYRWKYVKNYEKQCIYI